MEKIRVCPVCGFVGYEEDAVEVVRCKDCKHLKTMREDEGTCYYWCKHWNNATDDWGYCYYGERREEC